MAIASVSWASGDRSEGHRTGHESSDDFGRRLDFIQWHGFALDELEQPSNCATLAARFVRGVARIA